MLLEPKLLKSPLIPRLVILLVLVFLLGLGAIPGYVRGQWFWQKQPAFQASRLIAVQKQGLQVPGWKTLQQQTANIGGHRWSIQELQSESDPNLPPITLLLMPQAQVKQRPAVEWIDIKGAQYINRPEVNWVTDSVRSMQFVVTSDKPEGGKTDVLVHAELFRRWTQDKTIATTLAGLQWYAWATGGSPAPTHWFWSERMAQFQQQRLPWVAVCLLMPIEPLGDVEKVWPTLSTVGQKVQTLLMNDAVKRV